jgi:hypothetical protein
MTTPARLSQFGIRRNHTSYSAAISAKAAKKIWFGIGGKFILL